MIRNKIEVEIILTDSGNLRLCSNGASYLIEKFSPLSAGLEVDLLYSLGIMDKMKIKEGDSIISGGHYGIVIKALPFDEFITIKGIKAMGNQFAKDKVKTINITIPEPVEEIEEESEIEEIESDEEIPEEGKIEDLFSSEE